MARIEIREGTTLVVLEVYDGLVQSSIFHCGGVQTYGCDFLFYLLVKYNGVNCFVVDFDSAITGNIQLTLETETDPRIPFLDVLVQRNAHNFQYSIHGKPTCTNSLNTSSQIKTVRLKSLLRR